MNIQINGEWVDDLIWCPSQCHLPILIDGEDWIIYLRWRWEDPWTAAILKGNNDEWSEWVNIEIPFFKDSDPLWKVKDAALEAVRQPAGPGV